MPSRTDKSTQQATSVTERLLQGWPLPELTGSGKNSRGDVWVVGGARGTPGAAVLAGSAALRVGAGRLTLAVAESVATAVAVAVPESGVQSLPETPRGSVRGEISRALAEQLAGCDALLVGSGLDDADHTAALVRSLLPVVSDHTSVVLDAFALGILPDVPEVADRWAGRLVLTPNIEELERLLELPAGALGDPADLPDAVRQAARRYQAVITAHNVIADPAGSLWEAAPNCIGLGTSGSGDVLGGIVLGLLGRGADPAQAACWATYLHLTAGHRLTASIGTVGFLAGDLLTELPRLLDECGSLESAAGTGHRPRGRRAAIRPSTTGNPDRTAPVDRTVGSADRWRRPRRGETARFSSVISSLDIPACSCGITGRSCGLVTARPAWRMKSPTRQPRSGCPCSPEEPGAGRLPRAGRGH